MLNTLVSDLNTVVRWLIGGMQILSADHPIAMALILAGLAGASGAVMVDAVARRP